MNHARRANKRLLLLTHSYANFIKDQVDSLAPHFRQATVLVRCNMLSDALGFLPTFQPFADRFKIDLTAMPRNIHVFRVPLFYSPTDRGYKQLGVKHYQAITGLIRHHNIKFDLIHARFTWNTGYVGTRLYEVDQTPFFITAHSYVIYELPFREQLYWRWQHVQEMLSDHQHQKQDYGQTLWKVLNAELWLRSYF